MCSDQQPRHAAWRNPAISRLFLQQKRAQKESHAPDGGGPALVCAVSGVWDLRGVLADVVAYRGQCGEDGRSRLSPARGVWQVNSTGAWAGARGAGDGVPGELRGPGAAGLPALAQQGVVLYIVDSNYIQAPSDTRPQSPQTVRDAGGELRAGDGYGGNEHRYEIGDGDDGVDHGRTVLLSNDLTSGVDKVASDLRAVTRSGSTAGEAGCQVAQAEGAGEAFGPERAASRRLPGGFARGAARGVDGSVRRTAFSNPLGSPAIPLTAVCQRTPAGEVAITVRADTGALQFLPDGENLKANLEILIGDNSADGLARATRSTLESTVAAADWEAARQQATRHDGIWKPAADATALRVIVHDVNSGGTDRSTCR